MSKDLIPKPKKLTGVVVRRATQTDLDYIKRYKNTFNLIDEEQADFGKREVIFVAEKEKGKIIGFVSLKRLKGNNWKVAKLFLNSWLERRGLGSKLIGKANAFLVSVGAKKSSLQSTFLGMAFYNRTNYAQQPKGSNFYTWVPTRKKGVKKPLTKPPVLGSSITTRARASRRF